MNSKLADTLPLLALGVAALALGLVLGLAGCAAFRPAGGEETVQVDPPTGAEQTSDGWITIEAVQVTLGELTFAGRSTLPERTCVQTQLFVGESPEAWWPRATTQAPVSVATSTTAAGLKRSL